MSEQIYQGACTFYDGTSAKARDGLVEVSSEKIYFKETSLSARSQRSTASGVTSRLELELVISSIEEVVEQDQSTRILFFEGARNSAHQTLVLPVTGLLKPLHQARQHSHQSTLKGLVLRVKGLSWQKKIGLGVGLAAVNLSLYFILLYQSYHLIPTSFDLYLGRNVVPKVLPELQCKNENLEARIQKMVQKLRPEDSNFDYQIHFVEHSMPNAFAVPGGDIILFSGMLQLAESEEEIAGVLAHEIAHVEQRHSVQNVVRLLGTHYLVTMVLGAGFEELETLETIAEIGSTALFLKYSREFEKEADQIAIQYLHKNQVSLQGFQDFFKKLPSFSFDDEKEENNEKETAESIKSTQTEDATAKDAAAEDAEEEGSSVENYAKKALEFVSTHPLTSKRIAWLDKQIQNEKFKAQVILPKESKWKKITQVCPEKKKKDSPDLSEED